MPPKKNQRSALYYFAMECKDRRKLTGGMKDIIEEVYTEWKSMSTHEKSPYERMYEEWKKSLKEERDLQLTNPLIKSENLHYPYDMKMDKRSQQLAELKDLINKICRSNDPNVKTKNIEAIKSQRWRFIKFQSFCKCDISPFEKHNYVPYYVLAEVGIVEYSLQHGIIDYYHDFIMPNKLPIGYRGQCMEATKEIHQIPLENFKLVTKNHTQLYNEIMDFIKRDDDVPIPLFCMSKDHEETKFALQYIYDTAFNRYDKEFPEEILDLETLVVALSSLTKTNISFCSANDLLSSYTYDYSSNSRCDYHEELGISNCSLGFVKRYAYHLSDFFCENFGIELTPNHLPVEKPVGVTVNDGYTGSLSYGSRSASRATLNNSRYRGDEPLDKVQKTNFSYDEQYYEADDHENFEDIAVYSSNQSLNTEDVRSNIMSNSRQGKAGTSRRSVSERIENSSASQSVVSSSVDFSSTFSDYRVQTSSTVYSNMRTTQRNMIAEPILEDNEGWTDVSQFGKKVSEPMKKPDEYDADEVSSSISMRSGSVTSGFKSNIRADASNASTITDNASKTSTTKSFMGRGRGFIHTSRR